MNDDVKILRWCGCDETHLLNWHLLPFYYEFLSKSEQILHGFSPVHSRDLFCGWKCMNIVLSNSSFNIYKKVFWTNDPTNNTNFQTIFTHVMISRFNNNLDFKFIDCD